MKYWCWILAVVSAFLATYWIWSCHMVEVCRYVQWLLPLPLEKASFGFKTVLPRPHQERLFLVVQQAPNSGDRTSV